MYEGRFHEKTDTNYFSKNIMIISGLKCDAIKRNFQRNNYFFGNYRVYNRYKI